MSSAGCASCMARMTRMRQLGYANKHTLAYQSKVGPVEWVRPYTDDSIRQLGEQGVKSVHVTPPSDHPLVTAPLEVS